jgi:transcriptional regulator with XRE-family HTH domain
MPALPLCHSQVRVAKPPRAGYPQAPTTLGERLRRRRLDLGLSQVALARFLGVDPWTVLNCEKGKRTPSRRLVGLVSEFLARDLQGQQRPRANLVPHRTY